MEKMEEVLKRFMGGAGEIELVTQTDTGDDRIKLKMASLTVGDMVQLAKTLKLMKVKDSNTTVLSNILDNLTEEIIDITVNLGFKSLKPNYPDILDDDLKKLVSSNFMAFLMYFWGEYYDIKAAKT